MHLCGFSQTLQSAFLLFFTGASESGGSMRGCNVRKNLPVDMPKRHRGKIHILSMKNFKSCQTFVICILVFTLPLLIFLKL